jgi:hypothetical protein
MPSLTPVFVFVTLVGEHHVHFWMFSRINSCTYFPLVLVRSNAILVVSCWTDAAASVGPNAFWQIVMHYSGNFVCAWSKTILQGRVYPSAHRSHYFIWCTLPAITRRGWEKLRHTLGITDGVVAEERTLLKMQKQINLLLMQRRTYLCCVLRVSSRFIRCSSVFSASSSSKNWPSFTCASDTSTVYRDVHTRMFKGKIVSLNQSRFIINIWLPYILILWCDSWNPEFQRHSRRSLLGNDSVNRFPRKWARAQQYNYRFNATAR